MNITIRPGPQALEEAQTCAVLHTAAFTPSGARGWSAQEVEALLNRPTALLFTAPDAFLLAEIIDDEAEIITVAVAPAQQGRGIGHALVDSLLEECRCRYVTRCILEVAENNRAALKVYKGANFRKIAERPGYFKLNSVNVTAIVMERQFHNN